MDHDDRPSRISRVMIQNIAPSNYYKPVNPINSLFFRIKRNSTVLSQNKNHQHSDLMTSRSEILNEQLHEISSTKGSKVQSPKIDTLKRHQSFSLSLSKKSKKSLLNSQTLPLIRQSKQISLPSPKNKEVLKQKKQSSQNQIQGTRIGVLSSQQILKKYQTKKLREELDKKLFLDNYIKNMKSQGFDNDDSEDQKQQNKKDNKVGFLKQKISIKQQLQQNKSVDLSQSQHKLTQLLGNRLTDRDYIDFNVKLFEKRDINTKKYFQRYHNILKKHRQQISSK